MKKKPERFEPLFPKLSGHWSLRCRFQVPRLVTRTIIQRPDLHTNIGTRTRARAEAPVARRFSRYYYFPRLRRTTDTRACIHTRIQTRYTVRDGSYISSRVFDKYLIVSLQASRLRGPSRARARDLHIRYITETLRNNGRAHGFHVRFVTYYSRANIRVFFLFFIGSFARTKCRRLVCNARWLVYG